MQFIALIRMMYRFRKIITVFTALQTGYRAYKKVNNARDKRATTKSNKSS